MTDRVGVEPSHGRIPDDAWRTIVDHVPIVSVDLVVLHEGKLVLGKRQNAPAKGEWFVPGGRLHKHERLDDAVHRIAEEELGVDVVIQEPLGAYEHLYENAALDDVGGKHYIANGFVVTTAERPDVNDDQHSSLKLFDSAPASLHENVQDYLRDSRVLSDVLFNG